MKSYTDFNTRATPGQVSVHCWYSSFSCGSCFNSHSGLFENVSLIVKGQLCMVLTSEVATAPLALLKLPWCFAGDWGKGMFDLPVGFYESGTL